MVPPQHWALVSFKLPTVSKVIQTNNERASIHTSIQPTNQPYIHKYALDGPNRSCITQLRETQIHRKHLCHSIEWTSSFVDYSTTLLHSYKISRSPNLYQSLQIGWGRASSLFELFSTTCLHFMVHQSCLISIPTATQYKVR